ncbi:hypothetical protein DFJ74DRAFT_697572 [Hyaloraphidium curvatum]|nr:hypothetical protein DFJ74DRAFT_697572 [Hyaloraphidium curvatum]
MAPPSDPPAPPAGGKKKGGAAAAVAAPADAAADARIEALKAAHADGLAQLAEIFPEWTADDLVLVLDESRGDVDVAVSRISEGA